MTSTIAFPSTLTEAGSTQTNLSVMSRHATALEVCDIVYGNSESTTSLDAVERFYEANAIYENPFITATSRSVISDIYSLTRQMCYVDVPKPLAMLYILFRLKPPDTRARDGNSWFQGLRVWTEIGEICESESFDGHRRSIVEHTMNILFFPGLHSERMRVGHGPAASTSSSLSLGDATSQPHPSDPRIAVPGTGFALPSPLHLQLHILTRLSFNEQGLITHHRDIWDVKDVLGLVPGANLAQWITARIAARALTFAARILTGGRRSAKAAPLRTRAAAVFASEDQISELDLESGVTRQSPASQYGEHAKKVLGLNDMAR